MDAVAEFVRRYHRELDFYTELARLAAQQLEVALTTRGVRAIVTSRGKNPERLRTKLEQRSKKRTYRSIDDIYEDIVDLGGVRVALYFPGDRDKVDQIIKELFELRNKVKTFPEGSKRQDGKRFSGYWATHYRVALREKTLLEAQKRYAAGLVEIQVASVLMHSWAEVEHDLVYKPLQGGVSEDETAILDELNGLVLAGEIALERLQKAVDARLTKTGAHFRDQFDLGSFLFDQARGIARRPDGKVNVGRVDLLLDLLRDLRLDTPEEVRRLLTHIHRDLVRRPLADQLLDRLLAEDPTRYRRFSRLRAERQQSLFGSVEPSSMAEQQRATGFFLGQWIDLEKAIRSAIPKHRGMRSRFIPLPRIIEELPVDAEDRYFISQARDLRNALVHGITMPEPDVLTAFGERIGEVVRRLKTSRRRQTRSRR